jgi:hypothetical protein
MAKAVFIHGSLTISYQGSIAEAVRIDTPSLLNLANMLKLGGGYVGAMGIQGPDGTWNTCGGNSAAWAYTLQPHSTVTADMWIDYGILSNSHPTFTTADQQPLAITFAAYASDPNSSDTGTLTASGPGAAYCTIDSDQRIPTLLLYKTPPYNLHATDNTGTAHTAACAPA